MIRPIHSSPYMVTFHEDAHRLVVLHRSATPYPSIAEMEHSFQEIEPVLALAPRLLLVDMRDAPSRNDARFEDVLGHVLRRFFSRFSKVAVLVQTAAGVLQVRRLSNTTGVLHVPFLSLDEALAYLELPADIQRLLPIA